MRRRKYIPSGPDTTGPSITRPEQAKIVRTIGERMREARELCNLSQSEAARRLGYATPSKLSKIEKATDTNSVPLWVIVRAAKLYGVSVDFIFGVSKDWEADTRKHPERDMSKWLLDAIEAQRQRDMKVILNLFQRLNELDDCSAEMLQRVLLVDEAFTKFTALNPTFFDEMKGGASLKFAIDRSVESAKYQSMQLKVLHDRCRAGSRETPQLSLFDPEEIDGLSLTNQTKK